MIIQSQNEMTGISPETWSFKIGDRVRVSNPLTPDVCAQGFGLKTGTIVGKDGCSAEVPNGDQYFSVVFDQPRIIKDRFGKILLEERPTYCEDKADIKPCSSD